MGSRKRHPEMMSDEELRIYALETASRTEGAKAVAVEVLEAAERIYEFFDRRGRRGGEDAAELN
jgi:hypothetical protein